MRRRQSLLRPREILDEAAARAEQVGPTKLARIKNRLLASSYIQGGVALQRVIESADKNGDGQLDCEELWGVVRRTMQVPPSQVSDDDIAVLFRFLDADCSGQIGLDELEAFVNDTLDNLRLAAICGARTQPTRGM